MKFHTYYFTDESPVEIEVADEPITPGVHKMCAKMSAYWLTEVNDRWLMGKDVSGPRHADQCPWHLDQYDWECSCGLTTATPTIQGTVTVGPMVQLDPLSIMDFGSWPNFPTRPGTIPNPYTHIGQDTDQPPPEPEKPLTEAQKALGRAVNVMRRS